MIVEANLIDEPTTVASVKPVVPSSQPASTVTASGCTLSKFDPSQSIASTSIAEEAAFEVDSQSSSAGSSSSTSTDSTQTIIHVASDYCPATLSSSLGGLNTEAATGATLVATAASDDALRYSSIEVKVDEEDLAEASAVVGSSESTFLYSKPAAAEINFARNEGSTWMDS